MRYYNRDNSEYVDIRIYDKWKKIAISMSGGADSGMLAYLLVKQIQEEGLDIQIQPVTWRRPYPNDNPKDWNVKHAQQSITAIRLLLDADDILLDTYVFDPMFSEKPLSSEDETREWQRLMRYAQHVLGCDHFFYGTTSNPSHKQMFEHDMLKDREKHRDKEVQHDDAFLRYTPLADIDKRFLKDLYEQHNLLDTLFPVTRSCEGDPNSTANYTKECGKCWWCKERHWAFGKPDYLK